MSGYYSEDNDHDYDDYNNDHGDADNAKIIISAFVIFQTAIGEIYMHSTFLGSFCINATQDQDENALSHGKDFWQCQQLFNWRAGSRINYCRDVNLPEQEFPS